jgi:hypothetical protein
MNIEDACTYMTHCLRHEDAFLKTYAEKLEQTKKSFITMALPIHVLPFAMHRFRHS